MINVNVNFAENRGAVKPMHAVNNGPVYKFNPDQRITNIDSYREAGIPFARTHDASFFSTYGGEHTVDIHAIFPNFDADPTDPASYDFELTDEYLKVIELANTEVFYRLGSKIEHWSKKYGTLPPKDFKKWAVICEHIIRHYNEGWANGYHMNIRYWEIWNEPDLDPDDSTNKRCWGGTRKEFFQLYDIAAKHLKACFPDLKIGGPALAWDLEWAEEFLTQLDAPLDFFSWHIYAFDPHQIEERVYAVHALLNKTGYGHVESILNEWNYVHSFEGDGWIYSLRMEKSLKGAAFIAGTMALCQQSPLDMLMYYDARPCSMNGMFNTDLVCDLLKGYYPFRMFNELYKLDQAVEAATDSKNGYVCAARSETEAAIMLTHFNDDDNTSAETFRVSIEGLRIQQGVKAEYYLLDQEHDLDLVREEIFAADKFTVPLTLPIFGSYLIKLKAL